MRIDTILPQFGSNEKNHPKFTKHSDKETLVKRPSHVVMVGYMAQELTGRKSGNINKI